MWILIAIISYLLFAFNSLLDRYLLAGPLPKPRVYAFFVGMGGGLALLLIPFGFVIPPPSQIALSVFAGGVWVLAIFLLYRAVQKGEVSRVAPSVGGMVPVFTFFLTLLLFPEQTEISFFYLLSLFLLTAGSTLVVSKKGFLKNMALSALTALVFSFSFLLMKRVYLDQPFVSGFIWMRVGGMTGALFLLFSPRTRKDIFEKKELVKKRVPLPLVTSQLCGGAAFLLQSYAVSLARTHEVALINALEGVRYVFLFFLVFILGKIRPSLLKEKIDPGTMRRKAGAILLILLGLFLLVLPFPPQKEEIKWGVNFSSRHSSQLGLDWKENYLALIKELGVRRIKLITHWDGIEREEGEYEFEDLDWQIREAEKENVEILLVMGVKTPRWPECHVPGWAKNLPLQEQREKALDLEREIVLRYRDSDAIWGWQVENEPFFSFGEGCPEITSSFLKKEVDLVKETDTKKRPVLISDSGEWSLWLKPARIGDMVGTTLYRKVWMGRTKKQITYPLPPSFYYLRARLIEKLFHKKVICVELQAEPWGPVLLYDLPLEEQEKTMNPVQFQKNLRYARKTGFDEFYLWGAEWWYWLKQEQNDPRLWNQARDLFLE